MRKFCIASAAFVLAGCGGSFGGEDAAPSFSSGTDIQAALNKAGLTYPGYKPVVKEDRKLGMRSAADVGRCDLENENIIMAIWKDKGQKQNWIGMAEKIGCEMGKAFGVSSFDFVDSGRWTCRSAKPIGSPRIGQQSQSPHTVKPKITKSHLAARFTALTFCLTGHLPFAQLFAADAPSPEVRQIPPLSPEEELKTIQLPDGYKLELVLSEPDIKEPVAGVFDGNGRMYVAEMRTYMQDIDGTDEHDPKSRISRHESTKGDGVFDKHTVYLDNLMLPRMVLPLDDRVLVERDRHERHHHSPRHRSATAWPTRSNVWFAGGPRGGNLEHQPSGLVWGARQLDLHDLQQLPPALERQGRAAQGKPPRRTAASGASRRMTTARCGGRTPAARKGLWNFQTPIVYGAINVSSQKRRDFDAVWPLVGLADVQGGDEPLPPRGQDAQSLHRLRRADGLSRRPAAAGTLWQRVPAGAGRSPHPPRDGEGRRTASPR